MSPSWFFCGAEFSLLEYSGFFFFFPLIHRSMSFAQILSRMLGEGEVRSSELETSLSSSEQDNASEVSSKNPFYSFKGALHSQKER